MFKEMNHPLLGCGKLAQNECLLVLDIPNATVVTGKTKDAICEIIQSAPEDDIVLTVPYDALTLTWKINAEQNKTAYNVHRIRSKEVLVDYLHCAAGYPVKRTWIAAIKNGFYSTWPGLTAELVSRYLPDDTEEIAAGHLD